MPSDITVHLIDNPGSLAAMGEALGAAGVNILGTCGVTAEGKGLIHILVEDAAKARDVLGAAGIELGETRDVLVVLVNPVPGELGAKARALAEAGVNVDLIYLTEDLRLVFGVDDLDKAKAALANS